MPKHTRCHSKQYRNRRSTRKTKVQMRKSKRLHGGGPPDVYIEDCISTGGKYKGSTDECCRKEQGWFGGEKEVCRKIQRW